MVFFLVHPAGRPNLAAITSEGGPLDLSGAVAEGAPHTDTATKSLFSGRRPSWTSIAGVAWPPSWRCVPQTLYTCVTHDVPPLPSSRPLCDCCGAAPSVPNLVSRMLLVVCFSLLVRF